MAADVRPRPRTLLGRKQECDAIDRLLKDTLGGESQVLVLRGDAGVGKSTLLTYAADQARGWRVATAVGVESEMELAHSGLHQLCGPLLAELDELPTPQREALATVFGLSAGPPPDRFLVGLATLTLLAAAAERSPLLCLVDDAQWLDEASAQIVGFVGRRLLAERVAIVCVTLTDAGDGVLAGLPDLHIGGLADSDARALLLENVHGPLDVAVCDQIIAECHGNPLALLELPRTWDAQDLAGGFGVPGTQPVASRIEQSYAQRVLALPVRTRLLLAAAAAEPLGDPVLLHRAADSLGVEMAAADPAVDAGLVTIGRRVEFAHPLVRSAAYHSATLDDRHRIHLALANATDAKADPDRRAWHRARTTTGPDEAIAAELERSATRAQARGGLGAAAAFLRRATELTPEPARQRQRALAAAEANVQAGAFDVARALLAVADDGTTHSLQQARIDFARAQLAGASRRGNEATSLLLEAGRRLQPFDLRLAREAYLEAFATALFGARLNGAVGVTAVAAAARAAAREWDEPSATDLLLDAWVALTDHDETAIPRCREALATLRDDCLPDTEKLRWLWHGTVVALELWDDESADDISQQHVHLSREAGALSELARALSSAPVMLIFSGAFSAAASLVAEAESVGDATGIGTAPYGALMLRAWQGRERETLRLVETTIRDATARGEGIGVAVSEYTRSVLCNGLGRYDEALIAAHRASEFEEAVLQNWGLTELIEPATRTGRTDLARDALERLSRKANASGTDWALGLVARSQALVDDDEHSETSFDEALERLSRTRVRAELARTHLLYGEWLRRRNRRVDARTQLDVAYELFETMGMAAFAERTRHELLATGAKVRRRSAETRGQLTPQEEQIARLARDGRSNPEIGAMLFLSPRTVEWHLRKVFAKLGISSRTGLRDALPSVDQDTVHA